MSRPVERGPRNTPASRLGARLARERTRQCKSMGDLARIAGTHASEISRIENGLRDPKVSTAARLAGALKVPVSQLIGDATQHPVEAHHDADDAYFTDRVVYQRIGEALRKERRKRGLTQDDMALAAGLGLRAVGEVEAGKATAQFRTWLAIIEALGFKLVIVRRRGQSSP